MFQKIAIIAWIVISVSYIWYDVWSDFKVNIIQSSYQKGVTDTLGQVIVESEKWCTWFDVTITDKKANLVNTKCLESAQEKK
jgi:hypothetical protein